ncbi:MAG: HIT family protein [Candidatus Aenigmatarchaeota archaeon]
MEDCVFCKIGEKKLNSYIVFETHNFISFLDINPLTPGHAVVIPKFHIQNFIGLEEKFGEEFVKIIKETILKISKAMNTKDFTIGINDGKLSGRAIDHLHIHIIPRYKEDKGGSIHSIVHYSSGESLESIYNKIKNES